MAGKIELNLKQFSHVKSDDDCTTLRHKDGHELTLAHKPLSKEARTQLEAMANSSKKMADGGQVEYDQFGYPKKGTGPKSEATPKPKNEFKDTGSGVENTAGYDKPKKYAEGEMVVPDTDLNNMSNQAAIDTMNQPQIDPRQVEFEKRVNDTLTNKELNSKSGFVPNRASVEKNTLIDMANEADNKKAIESQATQDTAEMNMLRQKNGLPPIIPKGQEPGMTAQGVPAVQTPSPVASAPQQLPTQGPQDAEGLMASGYQNQAAGIEASAQAQGALGEQRAAILKQQEIKQREAQSTYDKNFAELESERQAHMQDIKNGYIDPTKYWTGDKNGNGGHSKIASAIGMIIAGFNPTSSPNAAINMLKYQMDQNLEAQKQNLGAKQNLLAANLRQFGNIRDAMDMTRLMQHDIMANELDQAAAKATSPMAKAAAMQAKGQLQMQYAPLQQQFAMRRAMMNLANQPTGGPGQSTNTAAAEKMLPMLRMLAPEQAKEMETRLVPQVGMANRPVAEGDRQKMLAHQRFGAAVQDMQHFVKTHSTVIPGTSDYNVGQQKAMALQALARESMLNTVYREGEQPLLDKLINSNPAGILKNIKTTPQLNELNNMNTRDFNIIKQSYGLPSQQAAQGPQIKVVNGIRYMRGPDGKAIPVK